MKLAHRESSTPKRVLRSRDALTREPVEVSGFSPDRDIPVEVKKALFRELEKFVEQRMWLEYVVLFNNLELLFSEMPEKLNIPTIELQAGWNNSLEDSPFGPRIILRAAAMLASSADEIAVIAAELKTFGLSLDNIFGSTSGQEFLVMCEVGFQNGSASIGKDALAAVRLGLRTKEEAFGAGADRRDSAWIKMEDFISSNRNPASFRIESLALAKILFPEKGLEASLELVAESLKEVSETMRHFGPSAGAEKYVDVLMACADSVTIGENGKLLIRRASGGKIEAPTPLPLRPVL